MTFNIFRIHGETREPIWLGEVEAAHVPGACLKAFAEWDITSNADQRQIIARRADKVDEWPNNTL